MFVIDWLKGLVWKYPSRTIFTVDETSIDFSHMGQRGSPFSTVAYVGNRILLLQEKASFLYMIVCRCLKNQFLW